MDTDGTGDSGGPRTSTKRWPGFADPSPTWLNSIRVNPCPSVVSSASFRLSRIHSVQIRVPHAKSAKDAKKLERDARKTSRQTVNGVSVDKMPPLRFSLCGLGGLGVRLLLHRSGLAGSIQFKGSSLFSVEQEKGSMTLLAIPAGCQKVAGG